MCGGGGGVQNGRGVGGGWGVGSKSSVTPTKKGGTTNFWGRGVQQVSTL